MPLTPPGKDAQLKAAAEPQQIASAAASSNKLAHDAEYYILQQRLSQ